MASSQVHQHYDEPDRYESPSGQDGSPPTRSTTALDPPPTDYAALRVRAPRPSSPSAFTDHTARQPRGVRPSAPVGQPHRGGLTASGAGAIAVLATGLAAIIDAAVSPGLGWFFYAGFLASSVVVAGRVSWRDAWAATMLPPLVFVAAAGIAAQVAPVTAGGWLDRTSADMLAAVVRGWVPLFLGVLLAAAVLVRRRSVR